MLSFFKKHSIAAQEEISRRSAHLNDYFTLAVYAFVYCDDEAAGIAARSTGFMMDGLQRAGRVAFLRQLAMHDSRNPEIPAQMRRSWTAKLITLADDLSATEWSGTDRMAAERRLKELAPHYLQKKRDPSVFTVEHPALRVIAETMQAS